MLTARIAVQGAGQENTKCPRLPLLRQKAGKARSPRGCPGQGKTNLRPPQGNSSTHLPICPAVCQGLLLSATNTLHRPKMWEPEPRSWARVMGSRRRGTSWAHRCGALGQRAAASSLSGPGPCRLLPGPPWLQAAVLASVLTLARPRLHALRRANRAFRPGPLLPEEPGDHVGQE